MMKKMIRLQSAWKGAAAAASALAAAVILSCTGYAQEELPEAFDPRPDAVSAIREQYWGACWAFGGISSLESYLIKAGMADTDIELSVEDVLWWCNGSPSGYGWTNRSRNDGGYAAMTTGYLETIGARLAEDIPYFGKPDDPDDIIQEFYGAGDNELPENFETAPVAFEVTDIVFLASTTPEEVKELILKYGALTVPMKDDPDFFREDTAAYWVPSRHFEEECNHSVSIVGWDDNFPRESFKEADGALPEHDGAWLIKNSYGTEYGGQGGYIYVSYEDAFILKDMEDYNQMYAIAGVREPLSLKSYLWDEFGAVSSLKMEGADRAAIANVYEFGAGEKLDEISFVTWSKGAQYHLYYAPVSDNVPSADEAQWKLLAEGTVAFDGYMTVPIEEMPEALPEGKGAIVLTLDGEEPEFGTDENMLHYGNPFFNAKADDGVSFILTGQNFAPAKRAVKTETMEYELVLNFCLRAYTEEVNRAEESE